MKSWDEYVSRTPEGYNAWIMGGQVEIISVAVNKIQSTVFLRINYYVRKINRDRGDNKWNHLKNIYYNLKMSY